MKEINKYIPGITLAMCIALAARLLENLENAAGLHLISASVLALFIGMAINAIRTPGEAMTPGVRFTSKKLLKFAIILLGASLNIATVITVGRISLVVMVFTLATCFGLGSLIGKALDLNWKTSSLINAGTGICGGSAIAAIAPVIEADNMDIAYGMSATFIFDMIMIVVFPLLGRAMGLSDAAFGLWTGTAVNDTSSVVAAGYAFSEAAGDFATMVKLTRTLSIIPAVLVFAAVNLRLKKKASLDAQAEKVSIQSIFPWFILGFLAMSALTSLGLIPTSLSGLMKDASKFLMVSALGAIGLSTDFRQLARSGVRPMIHGFIISLLVVLVAIGVEYFMGIAPSGSLEAYNVLY
ncbi:MAG: putative sulfate exporter family transporter [Tissierellia bacterium]|nr:putative sulfate exporter family transporter [Tissierellia bacterium]